MSDSGHATSIEGESAVESRQDLPDVAQGEVPNTNIEGNEEANRRVEHSPPSTNSGQDTLPRFADDPVRQHPELFEEENWLLPTRDLFSNTSLAPPASPPRQPQPPGTSRRGRAAVRRNPNRGLPTTGNRTLIFAFPAPAQPLLPSQSRMATQGAARDAHYSNSADRRADRLNAWRAKEHEFTAPFIANLQKFKVDDATTFEAFQTHMEFAALAARTAVRSHDIMLWYPKLPKDVHDSLMNVCSFYHGEAKQTLELFTVEHQAGSWRNVNDLDPEIVHAANATTIKASGSSLKVTQFYPFGSTLNPVECPGFQPEQFVAESELREDIMRALARCRVVEIYLRNEKMLGGLEDKKWDETFSSLLRLCGSTCETMRAKIDWINKPGVLSTDMTLFAGAYMVIDRLWGGVDHDGRLMKSLRGRKLARQINTAHERLQMAREGRPINVPELQEQCKVWAEKLTELEDGANGLGRLFGPWREVQMAVADGRASLEEGMLP